MAFVSGKAISNRKKFAQQLHQAVPSIEHTDFNTMRFLLAIDDITNRMNSPCLRLELLQYVLGLDNRYSIAHLKRAVELAATCLNISAYRNEWINKWMEHYYEETQIDGRELHCK